MGDPLQVASLNRSAGALFKQIVAAGSDSPGDTCYAQDADELIHAVEVSSTRTNAPLSNYRAIPYTHDDQQSPKPP